MTLDYPRIRAGAVCPFCRGPKAHSGIACWPCFKTQGLRDGETLFTARVLETTEQRLIERAERDAQR